jgi:hypothetical protein
MQQLWSQVLAGEANSPGSFSRRTVNLLSDLEQRDAEMFASLCGFGWTYQDLSPLLIPLVFDVRDPIYSERGMFYSNASHLESFGLVKFDVSNGFTLRNQPKQIALSYFGSTVKLTLPSEEMDYFQLGEVILTHAGQDLARICAPQRVEGFFEYVVKRWTGRSLAPEVLDPNDQAPGN